jgi:hypothetical protein
MSNEYRTNGTNKSEKEDEETVMSISQQNTMDLLSQKLWRLFVLVNLCKPLLVVTLLISTEIQTNSYL